MGAGGFAPTRSLPRTPGCPLPPPGGRSPGEWGRGGSGAQAHNSNPANYAREPRHAPRAKSTWPGAASEPRALETRGPGERGLHAGAPVRDAPLWAQRRARVDTQLPPLVLARKVPREASRERLSPEPRAHWGRTPPGDTSSLEGIYLRETPAEGRLGEGGSPAGRSVCRGRRAPLQIPSVQGHPLKSRWGGGTFELHQGDRREPPLQDARGANTQGFECQASRGRRHPPGRARPGARVCAGSRPPLQANGGGRPQPLRRAAASLSVSSPSGAWARRPGPHSPRRQDGRHRCAVSPARAKPLHCHPTTTRDRGQDSHGTAPQPRHPGSPRISRRQAGRCRARTRAPNKERRRTRPRHTRPQHFRRAGVSKFFPWATAPRPPGRPRFSPPPL